MTTPPLAYDDLRALLINCTLKRSPEISNTQGLVDASAQIMRSQGVEVDMVRAIDHDIATGVWPDMRDHGWASDDWPAIFEKVLAADILVLAGPIWLGDNSSVMKRVHERLYGGSHLLNEAGQYLYYGRVAGCFITGNEDGIKHCAQKRPLHVAAHRIHDSSSGRRRVDRRGRPWTVLPGSRIRWSRKRLHQPQHHIHDMEPHASRPDFEKCRWHSRLRKPTHRVGRGVSVRLREPGVPLIRPTWRITDLG